MAMVVIDVVVPARRARDGAQSEAAEGRSGRFAAMIPMATAAPMAAPVRTSPTVIVVTPPVGGRRPREARAKQRRKKEATGNPAEAAHLELPFQEGSLPAALTLRDCPPPPEPKVSATFIFQSASPPANFQGSAARLSLPLALRGKASRKTTARGRL